MSYTSAIIRTFFKVGTRMMELEAAMDLTELTTGGNLEMLKWARKNGCPWNKMECIFSAENDNLEILKWINIQVDKCNYRSKNDGKVNSQYEDIYIIITKKIDQMIMFNEIY